MGVFDVKIQREKRFCSACADVTDHERTSDRALWTCRDPNHDHVEREDQEKGVRDPAFSKPKVSGTE